MRNALESLLGRRRGCDAVEEHLDEYLAGSLPDDARARIAAHVTVCPTCQEKVQTYRRLGAALVSLNTAPIPDRPGNWQEVRNRLVLAPPALPETDNRPARPFWTGRVLAAGFAATAMGVAATTFPVLYPETKLGENKVPVTAAPQSVQRTNVEAPQRPLLSLGRVSVGEEPNILSVAPIFVGQPRDGIEPLVVEIGNSGDVVDAEITVRSDNAALTSQIYRQKVHLTARGKTRVFFYPIGPTYNARRSSDVPASWVVTLTAPGRKQNVSILSSNGNAAGYAVAFVGNRLNAVAPRFDPHDTSTTRYQPNIFPAYVAAENAPDRSIGYRSFELVVLSADVKELNAQQWKALREWVLSGGRLLLIGEALLDSPNIADILPVHRVPGSLAIASVLNAQNKEMNVVPGPDGSPQRAPISVVRYGQGIVAQTSFDPATEAFRHWKGTDNFWSFLMQRGKVYDVQTNYLSQSSQLWNVTDEQAKNDPFQLTFPSMQQVIFIFLGYFMLVVPVSFVVLKHARRLNWTWATGPILAVTVAGGIFLMTARLYFAPSARRTGGTVYLQSGENMGRFKGQTEAFFPRAGTYQLSFPEADYVQARMGNAYNDEEGYPQDTSLGQEGSSARLSVGNLTFRRIYHEQAVTLPGAVTVSVQPDGTGDLVGYVENATGQTLSSVLLEKEYFVFQKSGARQGLEERNVQVVPLGEIPAGRIPIRIASRDWKPLATWAMHPEGKGFGIPSGYQEHFMFGTRSAHRFFAEDGKMLLTLMAQVPGQGFGPAQGQDFSGSRAVTMLVSVTPQQEGGKR